MTSRKKKPIQTGTITWKEQKKAQVCGVVHFQGLAGESFVNLFFFLPRTWEQNGEASKYPQMETWGTCRLDIRTGRCMQPSAWGIVTKLWLSLGLLPGLHKIYRSLDISHRWFWKKLTNQKLERLGIFPRLLKSNFQTGLYFLSHRVTKEDQRQMCLDNWSHYSVWISKLEYSAWNCKT